MEKQQVMLFRLTDTLTSADIEQAYDIATFVCTLQGIVNRRQPRLLVYGLPYGNWASYSPPAGLSNIDKYFWDAGSRPGGWLEGYDLTEVATLGDLIDAFRSDINGVCLWDPDVDATVNVATTIAGVVDTPVVMASSRTGSLCRFLTDIGIPVTVDLSGMFTGEGVIGETGLPSTGSAKNDAYIWAVEKYLKTGRTNPSVIGYYEDAYARRSKEHFYHWTGMRDYLVAEKAFVCDLSVWDDEVPVDDPHQQPGLDRSTLERIFDVAYERNEGKPLRVVGFPEWAEKYTSVVGGKHDPVPTEWELAKFITPYHGYMVVDIYQGFTANISLHRLGPKPAVKQNEPPPAKPLENKTYILFYMGDYCDIGAVYNILPGNWEDDARGDIPLGWTYTPAMTDLIPDFFTYMYERRTSNDWFMAGPGTYGYNMPDFLPDEKTRTSCLKLAKEYFHRLDLDICGFHIGYGEPSMETLDMYWRLTPVGTLTNAETTVPAYRGMPVLRMWDLTTPGSNPESLARKARDYIKNNRHSPGQKPNFAAFRCIWVEPKLIRDTASVLKKLMPEAHIEVVDPYTFFNLLARSLQRSY